VKFGIVGLPQAGKSTVFNLLTQGHVDTRHWGGREEVHIGVAQIFDPKLERLAGLFKPKKITHATIEYVDLPGVARTDRNGPGDGAERGLSSFLSALKNADALAHVVRAFEDESIPHAEGPIDPARDIALFDLEMIFSDLAVAEKRLERLSKDLKKMKSAELEMENEALEKCRSALEAETPLRALPLDDEEDRRLRGFTFLSAKPLLILLNLGDQDADKLPNLLEVYGLGEHAAKPRVRVTGVCGKIEAELAALPEQDARLFMEDLGLAESGPARVVRESYALLDLITFYTVSENEARAWAVPRDLPAIRAAGTIHSDFERGFIKAEVVPYDHMLVAGSFHGARSKGMLRIEGRDYPVKDADVILFRFNV